MTNIYQAPSSDLTEATVAFTGKGSIENGIAGNYEFSIGSILGEAWEKTSGSKGTFWLAFFLYFLVAGAVTFTIEILMSIMGLKLEPGDAPGKMILPMIVSQVIQMAIVMPMAMGLIMIAIKRAAGASFNATDIFNYYNKTLPLIGTSILMYVLIIVGSLLLILPGIYLMVAYLLALPLVVEKNIGPWEALEASRKAITHHWFGFVGLYIVMLLIMVVGMIPLGIGMIWVMPMFMLVIGIVYRNIFGYEGSVAAS